jgi:transcription initiation factor TFIID subunit 6
MMYRFGDTYESLQARLSKTFHKAFLDPQRSFPTHYGAILGLMHLGPLVMERLLFPYVHKYFQAYLEPALEPGNPNPVQRLEAQHCFGVLVVNIFIFV